MSTFNGRRGPNVSQYLRDLNTVKPQETTVDDNLDFEQELAMFTNTQFFDFDSGQNTDFQAPPPKVDVDTTRTSSTDDLNSGTPVMGDLSNLDFMSADFNFSDFTGTYPTPSLSTFPDGLGNLQTLPHSPQTVYTPPISQQQAYAQQPSRVNDKRKPDALNSPTRPMSFEEASRVAAEEDKRRRNTAASARFRVKKKQREQALEKSAKEMTEKVTALEGRIQQLETENKWLKNLVMEKNEGSSKEEIAAILEQLSKKPKDSKAESKESTKLES